MYKIEPLFLSQIKEILSHGLKFTLITTKNEERAPNQLVILTEFSLSKWENVCG